MRPGVDVISRALPAPRSAPTDTGVAFVVGPTATSDEPYALVHSLTEFVAVFGARAGGEVTYDAADVYFREGGSKLYVAPTNYTAAVAASSSRARTKADADVDAQVVDAPTQGALDRLTADLGPGQVFAADPALAGVADTQSALLAHAAATNRVALLSTPDGTAATLAAAGTALQAASNGRYGALFGPSAIVPGVVAGTTRTVPYAAVQAGIIARNDVAYTPNQASAGVLGQTVYALDVNGRYTDAEYQTLNDAGVNMARLIYGSVRTYGYRAAVDPDASPEWLSFGNGRLNMAIVAQAESVGERFVFSQLDGRRKTIAQFGGELAAVLAPFYDAGALYGETPSQAYDVNVGAQVNTAATIAAGELRAVISVRMSPFAEWVVIEIVKVSTMQSLQAGSGVAVAA